MIENIANFIRRHKSVVNDSVVYNATQDRRLLLGPASHFLEIVQVQYEMNIDRLTKSRSRYLSHHLNMELCL